jgi:hypothetical protein
VRRHLFALGLAVLVLSAGCVGDLGGSSDPNATATTTPPTPSNWSTGSNGHDPTLGTNQFSNLSVGSPEDLPEQYGKHYYLIGNGQSGERTIAVTIWRNATVVLDRAIEFSPDGVLQVDVFRPGNYTLVVDPEDAPREVFDAPDEWDCNYRGVEMSVPPDGGLHAVILQSVVLCQNSDGGWGWSLSSTIGRNV